MAFDYFQFPYNSDNYGVLIHDSQTGATVVVDPGEAGATEAALSETGWHLSEIWITHHHWDHTDGLASVKAAHGAYVRGAEGVTGVDQILAGGDQFEFAGRQVDVLHTPGHTLDMLNFYLPFEDVVFTGDTLFVMGCGRLSEGTPQMMWESLQKLMALPPETTIYCSHEYTLANAKFALSVDPENAALITRAQMIEIKRSRGQATSPTQLDAELETNPFLRASDPEIRAKLGMQTATNAEVFTEIRRRKDSF